MSMLGNSKDLLTGTSILPIRKGKGSARIRGPLHIQYTDHGDDGLLRQLVEEVVAWPGIGLNPLPAASADLVSMRDQEQFMQKEGRASWWPI